MNLITDRSPPEQKLNRPGWIRRFWKRRRRQMAATALIVFGLSVAALMSEPPKYTATALMIVHKLPEEPNPIYPRSAVPRDFDLDVQAEILRSPLLIGRLVASLALHNDSEWNPNLSGDRGASLL